MTVKRKYNMQGTVSSERDGRGVPNLKVEAWDKDLLIDDLLGTAKTDEDGRFTLSFDKTYYQEICIDRKPDIYFKVFYEGKLIKSTEDSVLWNVEAGEVTIDIPVSIEPTQQRYAVKGKVTDKANNPLWRLKFSTEKGSYCTRQESITMSPKRQRSIFRCQPFFQVFPSSSGWLGCFSPCWKRG
jgi:hypothetical protein